MSEEFTQELGELEVTESPEAGSEPASTTSKGEESIDLDSVEKSTAEEQKEKQIASLMRKIESGELTLDSIPVKQKWAKEEIERRTALKQKEQAKSEELDVDAIVERKLREKQDEQDFQAKQTKLQALGISSQEREALLAEYKDLRTAGLSKNVALDKAMRLAGISFERSNPQMPSAVVSSRRVVEAPSGNLSIDQIMKLPKEKRMEELKKLSQ